MCLLEPYFTRNQIFFVSLFVVVRLFYFIIPIIIDNLSFNQVLNNPVEEEF
jgi:hypothetical protein